VDVAKVQLDQLDTERLWRQVAADALAPRQLELGRGGRRRRLIRPSSIRVGGGDKGAVNIAILAVNTRCTRSSHLAFTTTSPGNDLVLASGTRDEEAYRQATHAVGGRIMQVTIARRNSAQRAEVEVSWT
jgi:hypothetical protein